MLECQAFALEDVLDQKKQLASKANQNQKWEIPSGTGKHEDESTGDSTFEGNYGKSTPFLCLYDSYTPQETGDGI